jgi:hypothetical protein
MVVQVRLPPAGAARPEDAISERWEQATARLRTQRRGPCTLRHQFNEGGAVIHRLSRVIGFHVHGTDGSLGHIDDFLVDEKASRLCYLVVDTSNWMGGKWVALSPASISSIDWVEQIVHMAMTRDQIKHSPEIEETSVPSHELTPGFVIL